MLFYRFYCCLMVFLVFQRHLLCACFAGFKLVRAVLLVRASFECPKCRGADFGASCACTEGHNICPPALTAQHIQPPALSAGALRAQHNLQLRT